MDEKRPSNTWMRVPHGPIPERVRQALRVRLEERVRAKWADECREVILRFRGAFAYVDAFPKNRHHPPGFIEEQLAVIDATPVHLCRLGFLGNIDEWEYAFYSYGDETYKPSVVASGTFIATPEQAFDASAGVYLP